MAESWVMILQASLKNLVQMFLRACGPSAIALRVSFSAVSLLFHAFS